MRWAALGAIFCGLAVASGAFAAHFLDQVFATKYADQTKNVAGQTIPLSAKYLNDFKTGAEYQMFHGLALVAVGLIAERRPSRAATLAGFSFAVGILLFSGSLYLLTLTGMRRLGAITPIGGVAFLLGWAFLVRATINLRANEAA